MLSVFLFVLRLLITAHKWECVLVLVLVAGKMSCGVCFRSMAQCLMFIFHLITIPEDIVVLHMCNILETQVANLMLCSTAVISVLKLYFTSY